MDRRNASDQLQNQVDDDRQTTSADAAATKRSAALQVAHQALVPQTRSIDVVEAGNPVSFTVTRRGIGPILTVAGWLWQYNFAIDDQWGEYHAIVAAGLDAQFEPVFPAGSVLVRLDSGCTTGQLFTDKNCDCADQLRLAMVRIAAAGGVIIAIPAQEGRGKGPGFKLATLGLQQQLNLDTYDAAHALADVIDVRTYGGAIAVLKFLGITTATPIGLMTNNPAKLAAIAENGYAVERVPIRTQANEHTAKHLAAKFTKLGHLE